MTRVIVDSGHLVAYFNRRDPWHRWVVNQLAPLAPPQITCGSVLTEACFLIQGAVGQPADLLGKISQGSLASGIDVADDASSIESLMRRCADTPICLADACLVRLPERLPNCRLFELGRPGRVPGTRELVVPNSRYVVPYRVRGEIVEILRVLHTSRRRPSRW